MNNQVRIVLRKKLAERDISVTELAKEIGHPRESVSRAINQQKFPRVLAKVKEALRGS